MAPVLDSLYANPLILKGLHFFAMTVFSVVSGVSVCLLVWVAPNMYLLSTSLAKIKQFSRTIALGHRYQYHGGRIGALTILSLASIYYHHPDPELSLRWRTYAAALCTVAPIVPLELFFIFPINDKVSLELGGQLRGMKKDDFGDERDKKVDELLRRWNKLHVGRVLTTLGTYLVLALLAIEAGKF